MTSCLSIFRFCVAAAKFSIKKLRLCNLAAVETKIKFFAVPLYFM